MNVSTEVDMDTGFILSVDKTEYPAAQKKCQNIWDILNTSDTENGCSFIRLITFEGILKSIGSHLIVAFVCNYVDIKLP